MVTQQEFPAAYFGRKLSAGGSSDQYSLLGKSTNFPDLAMECFLALVRCVQWKSGPEEPPYDPCFAAWPVETQGWIVARFSDAGKDQKGRPHSIHVQAAWISRDSHSHCPATVGQLLQEAAWPGDAPRSGDAALQLNVGIHHPDLKSRIVEALNRDDSPTSVLITNNQFCHHKGFGIVQESYLQQEPLQQKTVETPNLSLQYGETPSSQTPTRSRGLPFPLAFCFFGIAFGVIFFEESKLARLESDKVKLEQTNRDLHKTKEELETTLKEMNSQPTLKQFQSLRLKVIDAEKKFDAARNGLDAVQKELDHLTEGYPHFNKYPDEFPTTAKPVD